MSKTFDAVADPRSWLDAATIGPEVARLRPDYRCVLVVAQGLMPAGSSSASEGLLAGAEAEVAPLVAATKAEDLPHVAAWREVYRAFGAKPQRTRNSVEALLRRVGDGLPRVNALTDAYNAVSIRLQTPLGGESLAAYQGPLRLVRATGDEDFETMASGAEVVEHPEPGEVVWRDDVGVTCRRWNWRQCYRTRLTGDTTDAVFIGDVLDVEAGDGERRAELVLQALSEALHAVCPEVVLTTRTLAA